MMILKSIFRTKPILVTGSHRSGTTWVGKMLSIGSGVVYINEIFNVDHGLLKNKKLFKNWFMYITRDLEKSDYTLSIKQLFDCKVRENRVSPFFYLVYKLFNYPRPLLKDPIAVISSEWLATKFNMDVVLLIRHPAAFVSSLKRLNWRFDFDNFLKQEQLMKDHLYPFKARINKKGMDFIEEASLLWLCINSIVDIYAQRHPEWIIKRHEDISLDPLTEFSDIYQRLGLHWSSKIERHIRNFSSTTNLTEAPNNNVHYLLRNSRDNMKVWKQKLSEDEITRIRNIVEPLSSKFYQESDW